jgi:hypothetical protein
MGWPTIGLGVIVAVVAALRLYESSKDSSPLKGNVDDAGVNCPDIHVIDATPEQATQIRAAHDDAVRMIDAAVERLERAKTGPDPLAAKYFGVNGTTPADQERLQLLIDNYGKMKSDMQGGMTYNVDTVFPSFIPVVASAPNNSVSKLLFWGDQVHLHDQNFFDYPQVSQSHTLVHEMSHYSAGTEDHAYNSDDDYQSLTPEEKVDNADNYADFAFESKTGFAP